MFDVITTICDFSCRKSTVSESFQLKSPCSVAPALVGLTAKDCSSTQHERSPCLAGIARCKPQTAQDATSRRLTRSTADWDSRRHWLLHRTSRQAFPKFSIDCALTFFLLTLALAAEALVHEKRYPQHAWDQKNGIHKACIRRDPTNHREISSFLLLQKSKCKQA